MTCNANKQGIAVFERGVGMKTVDEFMDEFGRLII